MKTPNLFEREGNVIRWGTADEVAETLQYNSKTDFNRLDVEVVERFEDTDPFGDPFPNARLKLSLGNITAVTMKACPIYIGDNNGSANETYDLQEVLDFFMNP
jgi:hypothetical protein